PRGEARPRGRPLGVALLEAYGRHAPSGGPPCVAGRRGPDPRPRAPRHLGHDGHLRPLRPAAGAPRRPGGLAAWLERIGETEGGKGGKILPMAGAPGVVAGS